MYKRELLLNFETRKRLEFDQEDIGEEYLLRVNNLNFSYDDKTAVLENVSFNLKRHDVLWVKGKNGSGKTTLLKLISNKIALPGVWYNEKLCFSMLMQEPEFIDEISGKEFLKREKNAREYSESIELCRMFDIPMEILDIPCEKYSAGERKKICLAKILSQKNNMIVLDEPLNYMDIMFREQLEEAIKHISPTMIFVEHDSAFGLKIATSVLQL